MRLCPHCANPVEETASTCPFCKAALDSEDLSRQKSTERADFPRERELAVKKKTGRIWGYLLVAALLAVAVFFTGKNLIRSKGDFGSATSGPDENARELEEANRQIATLDDQITQLRKEVEESSRRVTQLEVKLEEMTKALPMEPKPKNSPRIVERSPPAATGPRERETPQSTGTVPITRSRRPAESGTYEVIRTTEVFEEPAEASRSLSTIKKGTRVAVVRSVGEWLEVRSKHGNPPGFVRRDDAMFVEKD